MSKAEKFIQDYTRNCSNEYLTDSKPDGLGGYISRRNFSPWLTPDQARKAVEIAREETIEKACEYIIKDWWQMLIYDINDYGGSEFNINKTIERFKQAMKDE